MRRGEEEEGGGEREGEMRGLGELSTPQCLWY